MSENHRLTPSAARFLQKDPLGFGGGDANLFRYCGGDPVNWRDPNGLQDIPLTPSQDYINGLTAQYYTEQSAGITAVNTYRLLIPGYRLLVRLSIELHLEPF